MPTSRPPRHRRDHRAASVVWTIAAAAAAIMAVAAIDGPGGLFVDAPHPTATAAVASVPPRPDDAFAMTVGHVFDGDTIEARVTVPNDVVPTTDPVRVRLIGIDTPEGAPSPQCWADAAREHLRALLPEGSTAWAAPDTEWRDRHDRVLLYLWTEDGRFVNHELVAAGAAESLVVRPNAAHSSLFATAEATARGGAIGQWGSCP